jgi:hypothetical protein
MTRSMTRKRIQPINPSAAGQSAQQRSFTMCMNWISKSGEKNSKPKGGSYIAVYPSKNKKGGTLTRTHFSISKEFMVDARLMIGDRVEIGYDGKKFGLRKGKGGFKLSATTKGATGTAPCIVSAPKVLIDDRVDFTRDDVTFSEDGNMVTFKKVAADEVLKLAVNS